MGAYNYIQLPYRQTYIIIIINQQSIIKQKQKLFQKMPLTLEQVKQLQLKYKNKIIQLQQQLSFQTLRATQYETKFKQAVMENSSKAGDQQLLKIITEKQLEISELRKQLLDVKRKLSQTTIDNNSQQIQDLMKQNLQMRNVVEQLKNAAIAAIMEKDAEVEELKKQIAEMDLFQHVAQLQQINQQLQANLKQRTIQYQQQIKKLTQKLTIERDNFSQKLDQIHRQYSHQQSQKEQLLQKAQNLEGNLQTLQKVISNYEAKIHEIENIRSSDKITFTKNQHELQTKIQNLMDDIKTMQKNDLVLQQTILSLNKAIQDQKKKIQAINQQKQQLDRKLKIKNRKTNVVKQTSKSICDNFEGFSRKADVFASFVRRQPLKQVVKQSFVGGPIKLSDIKQIQIEQIQNFGQYNGFIQNVDQPSMENAFSKRKNSDTIQSAKPAQSIQTANTDTSSDNNTALKGKQSKIQQLQSKIQSLLNQIDNFNKTIDNITKQIQKQRQQKLNLKQKHAISQSQFKVQKESLKLHIYKLQNALLTQKLQHAQKIDSYKEVKEYEKKQYQKQIQKLKTQIENLTKKKKGFFG